MWLNSRWRPHRLANEAQLFVTERTLRTFVGIPTSTLRPPLQNGEAAVNEFSAGSTAGVFTVGSRQPRYLPPTIHLPVCHYLPTWITNNAGFAPNDRENKRETRFRREGKQETALSLSPFPDDQKTKQASLLPNEKRSFLRHRKRTLPSPVSFPTRQKN